MSLTHLRQNLFQVSTFLKKIFISLKGNTKLELTNTGYVLNVHVTVVTLLLNMKQNGKCLILTSDLLF